MPVLVVFPTALLGDGLQHLGGCSPALFGGLLQVAGGQLLLGLGQEPLAGLLIRLGGHGQSLGYQLPRAGGKESSLVSLGWLLCLGPGTELTAALAHCEAFAGRLGFWREWIPTPGSHNARYVKCKGIPGPNSVRFPRYATLVRR